MTTQTEMLHIRIDGETKHKAATTLNAIGLSVSDAVRLFLHRVVAEQALPLDLKVPNAATRAAMAEAEKMALTGRPRFGTAGELFDDLEKAGR